MNCEFCNNSFCSKSNLTNHQWTAYYCIKQRNDELRSLRILVKEQKETIEQMKGKLLEKETTIISLENVDSGELIQLDSDEPVLEDNLDSDEHNIK